MEVKKFAPLACLLVIGCTKSKTVESVTEPLNKGNGTVECPSENFIKNQFIVKYENGKVGIVRAENEYMLKKYFVEPNLTEIKRVEYDSFVKLSNSHASSEEVQDSSQEDWAQSMIHAPTVWSQGVLGEGVNVAILDTAVDITHPQLGTQILINQTEANGLPGVDDDNNGFVDDIAGWDFINNSTSVTISDPENYHGSHVAGIVAADPTKGDFSGIAPKAKILPATFLDSTHGSVGGAIMAMQYAANSGAKILNASWGGPSCAESLREAIAELEQKNILFVVAAGNEGFDYDRIGPASYQYPAVFNLPHMISVAATDAKNYLTSFSNRSFSLVHIGAPGNDIRSTVPYITSSTGYLEISGTSMATPFVSGAAALLWSAKPSATVAEIRKALLSSTDYHSLKVSSQGRLNIEKALSEIRRIVP